MSISLPTTPVDIRTYGLIAGNTLTLTASGSGIAVSGNAGFTTLSPGAVVTHIGTTPVGTDVSPLTTEISEIFGLGGTFAQIYAPVAIIIPGNITTPTLFLPGVYEFTGPNPTISSTITLSGTSTDQFIFRSTSSLTFNPGYGFQFIGSVNTCNIYWASQTDITFSGVPSNANQVVPGTFISNNNFTTSAISGFFGLAAARNDIFLSSNLQIPGLNFTSQSNECRILCIAPNAKVLLSNGNYIPISDLKRGDCVSGDLEFAQSHIVARVEVTRHSPMKLVNMMIFEKDSLGENIPCRRVTMTSEHPIFYDGKRVPAFYFRNLPGVKFERKYLEDMISANLNGEYCLYDLQFEDDGSYVVDGIQVQSRKPTSCLTPLPKELYFNVEKYTMQTEDDYIHSSQTKLTLVDITV